MTGKFTKVKETSKTFYSHIEFLVDAIKNFGKHDGMVMAGHMAFLILLALFPFIIFLVSLAGFFGQSDAGTQALELMFENMPEDVVKVLRAPIEKMVSSSGGGVITFSIIGAIWVSSNAIDAARLAIVRAFATASRRPFLRRRAEGLVLVILSASSIIIGMSVLVLGPVAWKIMINYIESKAEIDASIDLANAETWKFIWNFIRFTTSICLVWGALSLVYFILRPHKKHLELRPPVAPGALCALILWMGIGSTFSLYLKHFADYSSTYGSMAGPIIALMFFYFMSAAFIIGAEINASLYNKRIKKMQNAEQDEKTDNN